MTARGAKANGENVYLFRNNKAENCFDYEYIPATGASGGSMSYAPGCTTVDGKKGADGKNRTLGGRWVWSCTCC